MLLAGFGKRLAAPRWRSLTHAHEMEGRSLGGYLTLDKNIWLCLSGRPILRNALPAFLLDPQASRHNAACTDTRRRRRPHSQIRQLRREALQPAWCPSRLLALASTRIGANGMVRFDRLPMPVSAKLGATGGQWQTSPNRHLWSVAAIGGHTPVEGPGQGSRCGPHGGHFGCARRSPASSGWSGWSGWSGFGTCRSNLDDYSSDAFRHDCVASAVSTSFSRSAAGFEEPRPVMMGCSVGVGAMSISRRDGYNYHVSGARWHVRDILCRSASASHGMG